ncbi:MAG TPA: small-conductance mechanosensitive channel, partial [Isosphaeraceae bacterium]|nr:small-conductance mechanosensitive channel [Isosphaeraceae bacterium]
MKALRTLLFGIGYSAIWPLYLVMLASATRAGPWPGSVSRPLRFVLMAAAGALFAGSLARLVFRKGGWAETALRMPREVARHLGRSIIALIIAALVLLVPEALLELGLVAPAGRPITVIELGRLMHLAFEVVIWVLAFRLVWSKRAIGLWIAEHSDELGWVGRHMRKAAVLILGAIGVVIALDAQGYGFTARRLATAGGQTALLLGLGWGAYVLLLRAIDHHSWHWIRAGLRRDAAEPGEPLKDPHDLAKRLRNLVNVLVPIAGVFIGAWIWNVDLALFRSMGETSIWSFHPGSDLTLGDLTKGILTLLVTIGAWRHMSTFFTVAIFPRMADDPGVRYAVFTLCRYAVLGIGLLVSLSAVHLGVEQIGMVLAALGVGLGFGLQEIVS